MINKNKFLSSVFFFLTFLWFAAGSNYNINIYDEGIGIVGSSRVINGELPYSDFWTMYSPGWYYFQAAFMLIFGDNMQVIRLLNVVINTLCVIVVYLIMVSQSKKPYFVSISAVMLISLTQSYGMALPFAILLLLIAYYFLVNSKDTRYYIFSGITTGLLFTIRHDFAVYFIIAATAYIFLSKRYIEHKGSTAPILVFLSSFSVVAGLFVLSLYASNTFNEYIQQAYIFPFNHFAETRSLPFPNPFSYLFSQNLNLFSKFFGFWNSLIFYTVPILVATCIFVLYRKGIDLTKDGDLVLSAMLCSVMLSIQGLTRSDFVHILPATIFSLLLLPVIIDKFKINNKYLLLGLMLLIVLPPTIKKAQLVSKAYFSSDSVQLNSDKAKWIKLPAEFGNSYNELLEFLYFNCKDDYIYSGSLRHNQIIINDVMLYYLSGKKPAVAYHELHPRQASEETEQKEIILSLKNINWVVLYSPNYNDKNENLTDSNVFLLDDFLRENYTLRRTFADYYVFERK